MAGEALEHIRHRPAMYIGSVDQKGIDYLTKNILECLPDSNISKSRREIIITGQGPPFSVEVHPKAQKTFFEIAFTVIGTGQGGTEFFLVVLNALSEFIKVETV